MAQEVKAALLAACVAIYGCDNQALPPTPASDEEIALGMQCHDRHGTLAMAHGPHGEWVECYQGRKKLWGVRL